MMSCKCSEVCINEGVQWFEIPSAGLSFDPIQAWVMALQNCVESQSEGMIRQLKESGSIGGWSYSGVKSALGWSGVKSLLE